jgi:hypothetical protein
LLTDIVEIVFLESLINHCHLLIGLQLKLRVVAWLRTSQFLLNHDALGRLILQLLLLPFKRVLYQLLMVNPIIQLAIVIELELSINFATPSRELQPFAIKHFLVHEPGLQCLLGHRAVEGRQNDGLGCIIIHFRVQRFNILLREPIQRFPLISLVPGRVVVSVLFIDQLALFLREQFNAIIVALYPRVLVNLFYCQTFLRVDFHDAPQQVNSFFAYVFF